MTGQPERDLRAQVRGALAAARISQAEAARQLGLSTKHMSHMLTGRATLTLAWADRILTLCGMSLAVVAVPARGQAQPRISLDDLTSDALDALYDERNRAQRSATHRLAVLGKRREQIRALKAEVVRLAAGQCTHTRAMCEQHHAAPVAGCPYPRCRAATAAPRQLDPYRGLDTLPALDDYQPTGSEAP